MSELIITNVYVFVNDQVMVFDQFGRQMPEYQGQKDDVLPKIKEVFKGHIEEDVMWKRRLY